MGEIIGKVQIDSETMSPSIGSQRTTEPEQRPLVCTLTFWFVYAEIDNIGHSRNSLHLLLLYIKGLLKKTNSNTS